MLGHNLWLYEFGSQGYGVGLGLSDRGLRDFKNKPVERAHEEYSQSSLIIMQLTNHSAVPVYTTSGSSTARPLPEWLARKRKRSLKKDPEYANRVELLQDFEFEEASQCVRISQDGQWVMSTGKYEVTYLDFWICADLTSVIIYRHI